MGLMFVFDFFFDYCFGDFDWIFNLLYELEEIFGLGILEDGEEFVVVQDEDGIFFFINFYNGEVIREVKFWKDGDYEGVEWVGNIIYVVKSMGIIYEVMNLVKVN